MSYVLDSVSSSHHYLLNGPYAAIDTEYEVNLENKSKPYTIFAASIVDSDGEIKAKHVNDFQDKTYPEKELVIWLMEEMLKYKLTIGWYSRGVQLQKEDGTYEGKDSDLKIIDTVCRYYDIPSIIAFLASGIPYVQGYNNEVCEKSSYHEIANRFRKYYHIDLYQVYKKPLVRSIVYQNRCKDLSLDSVCRSIVGEGKYENLDGLQIQKLSKDKQLEYVSQDSKLVMKLSKHDNFKILDLMSAISLITGVPFVTVCHTGIYNWWTKIIGDRISPTDSRFANIGVSKRRYSGGYVIEPKVGFYDDQRVYVLDVKSLYPTMMINHSISFDTVNCECCKDDPESKVDEELMNIINSSFPQGEKREDYWICNNPDYTGVVPQILQELREERFKQKELGNEPMQLALKNLINGCYGLFGSEFFIYSDYRVAELTTAYGRLALQFMQHIAKEVYRFEIIYGDTDSIFVTNVKNDNDIKKFIAECSIMLDLDVEVSDIFQKFLITKKKHHIGIPLDESREPIIKGMEGIKGDRPTWIHRIQRQLVDDIKNEVNPTINVGKEFKLMEQGRVSLDDLPIRLALKKNPSEYKLNSFQRKVGLELKAEQGDVLNYYKSCTVGGGTSKIDLLSREKYLVMLRSTVSETLKVMGYDFDQDVIGCKKLDDFNN